MKKINDIFFSSKSLRQLKKLPINDISVIRNAINDLANMPDCLRVKMLVNHDYQYRLRVDVGKRKYRVLFNYDSSVKIVEIKEIKKRNEQTY